MATARVMAAAMTTEQTNPSTTRRATGLTVILTTVVINMVGVGLAWPVLPKLIQDMGSGAVSEASYAYAIIGTLFAVSQFLFAPLIGTLSDRFGRRPVLIVSLLGLGLDYLLTALAPTLIWLGIIRFFGGMFAATVTTANAYAADISSPEDRARNFGFIGAAFGVGFVLGPLLGGWLGAIHIHLPFLAAGALALANAAFAFFALPESLGADRRRAFDRTEANPLKALRRVAAFPSLRPLLIALFLSAVAQRGLETTWVLYTEFRFGWDIRAAAWSLAFVGVMYFIVQGLAVGPVVKRLGEWRTVMTGFVVSGVSLLFYGTATEGWMVYPLIAAYVVGNGLAGPSLNAICSRTVEPDRQGQVQGILQSINALAVIIGPFAASLVLAGVSANPPVIDLPGLWFMLSAMAFATALFLALRGWRKLGRDEAGKA